MKKNKPKLTKSRINAWENCKRQYELQYLDEKEVDETPPALKRGIEIHDMLEEFYEPDVTTISEAASILARHPHAQKYSSDIKNFIEFNKNLSEDGDSLFRPELTEEWIKCEEINVTGILDALWVDGDKRVMIDYKTGKTRKLDKYSFGMNLYVYLTKKTFPELSPTHWGIFFTKGNDLKMREVSQKGVARSLAKVGRVRREIRSYLEKKDGEGVFPKDPTYPCRYCQFYNVHCSGQ